ncbi:MAG: methyltransferase domain-containing protein [Sphingobacteriales bacterium]|nr:methyltransferase domain-containing protein [Sphingobacteriales bacterium]OJY84481.1 MAG: methyltransferase type 11 [Sphingobacteriales bacterium 44-15]
MEQALLQIRDQQKESWNRFSPGWSKWEEVVMNFLKPVGEEIIQLIRPSGEAFVLDVAAGTGEPGLTIASMLKGGKVIATDLSEGMLEVAAKNAVKRGIENYETVVADVCELPFENSYFDAVSCRFGFMFFPDMQVAANEMVRVLKPGGRLATSVWNGPEKNFWVTAIMGIIKKNMDLPSPPPGAPGMFRCAQPGLLGGLFANAGLKNITEKEITGKLNAGSADNFWNFTMEVGAPIVAVLGKADEPVKQKIKEETFELLREKYPDGNVSIESSALVIYGEKAM